MNEEQQQLLLQDNLNKLKENAQLRKRCQELEYQREFVDKLLNRIETLEFNLKDLALFVSVGGFNNDEVPEDIVERIKEGITELVRSYTLKKTEQSKELFE